MRYTELGRTGLETSVIGLGLEHLQGQPQKIVVSTIRQAIEHGVTYFDVIFSMPEYLENVGTGIREHRNDLILTAHLGSAEKNGQYQKIRSLKRCSEVFHRLLDRLGTDHVDILFLHNFNTLKDWERASGGYLDLALQLREEGKARFLGVSGHSTGTLERIVGEAPVDVVMFPVNLFNHALPHRQDLLQHCAREQIALIAMKPFGGGKLLNETGTIRVPKYQTGGEAFRTRIVGGVTPVQCLSYVMSQIGVTVALAGVKKPAELMAALAVLASDEEARDYGQLLTNFDRYVEGECTYCNHCLPCPANIDIGQLNRLLDEARLLGAQSIMGAYNAMAAPASACTSCGACVPRCPFGVAVMERISEARAVFEPVVPRAAA